MVLVKRRYALLRLAMTCLPSLALPGLLGACVESAPETSQAALVQPLLDGVGGAVTQLGDGLSETLDRAGTSLSESLKRFFEGAAELLQRLNGRFVETVEGSEAMEIAVAHQGLGRRVVILRPSVPSSELAPALLLLHYANGTPEQMANLARVSRLAAERGAWIILPEAVNGQWREDPNSLDLVDDVGFLEKVIAVVLQDYPIDAERLHLAGMSKGGFMATRMACQSKVVFAGLGLVAASMRRQQDLQCPQDLPLRVMLVNGTRDFIVPYNGRLGLLSANAHFDRWALQNGCEPASEFTALLPQVVNDGTSVHERSNTDCLADSAVSLLTVEGGGHTWPGSIPLYGISIGQTSGNLDASYAMWEFFQGGAAN